MTTTRYVKVNKKEVYTPQPAATSSSSNSRVYEPKVKTETKPAVVNKETNGTAATAAVAAQPEHFPTTNQFDTALEEPQGQGHNWSSSFYGLSTEKFPKEVSDILMDPINPDDVEIKPGKNNAFLELNLNRIDKSKNRWPYLFA